jgi:hypothetical protein
LPTPETDGKPNGLPVQNTEKQAIVDKVMKHDVILSMILAALHNTEGVPQGILDQAERILSEGRIK